jgi:hypothetical protein
MRHGLSGLLAGVEDDAVTATADALGHRDLVRLLDHLGEQAVIGGGERRDVGEVLLRDDEHVSRSLRVDIAERQYPVGLPDRGRGDLTGDDGAEQAVSHTKILEGRPGSAGSPAVQALNDSPITHITGYIRGTR